MVTFPFRQPKKQLVFVGKTRGALGPIKLPANSQSVPVGFLQAGLSFMAYETLKAQIAEDGDLGVHQRLRLGSWKKSMTKTGWLADAGS